MRLKGKVVIVTGGASGLGLAGAKGLAREGAQVVIADSNAEAGTRAVADIQVDGGQAMFVQTDVTRAADCEAAVQMAERAYGSVNAAWINAAVQLHGQDTIAHELPEAVWDRTFAINLKGMWLSCRAVLPALIRASGGSLVLTGSPTGLNGAAGYTAYATSKAGSYALARTIAADYARHKIRANVLVPGPMNTPMTAPIFADPAIRQPIENATMLGRIGEAHEIVGLLTFLVSDESSYCTGGYYMADGGITAL